MTNPKTTISGDSIRANLENRAQRMTGHKVHILVRKPGAELGNGWIAGGEVYRLSDGSLVINILPDMTLSNVLWIFLHEIAHIRKHYDFMAILHDDGVFAGEPLKVDINLIEIEREADAQAKAWLDMLNTWIPSDQIKRGGPLGLFYAALDVIQKEIDRCEK